LVAKLRTTTSQLGRRAISERSSATAASVAPGPAVLQLGRSADVLAGKVLEGAIDRPERSRRIASEELLDREVETGKGVGRVQQLGQLTERVVIPINPKVYDGAGTDLFRRSALNDQKRRGHPAPRVTSRLLPRHESGKKPTSQGASRALERGRHRRPHIGRTHHARLHREAVANHMPSVIDAEPSGGYRNRAVRGANPSCRRAAIGSAACAAASQPHVLIAARSAVCALCAVCVSATQPRALTCGPARAAPVGGVAEAGTVM